LTEVAGKLAERVYQQSEAQQSAAGTGAGAGEGTKGKQGAEGDVVDAEFEEVDDDKK